MTSFVPSSHSNGAGSSGADQNSTDTENLLARGWASLPPEYAFPADAPSLEASRLYCKRLATSHYENFSVATWFLPKSLHQHFFNVYAYCRISDDLGDETGDTQVSLALLDRWEQELNATYDSLEGRGNAEAVRHPVFIALAETIRECAIPRHEFSDLLTAFRQDQTVTRYETFEDLLGYCKNSANPVGHLVLYLCRYTDAERQQLSDYTCTALQLANFWQDVAQDYARGRIYLPLDAMERYGVTEAIIAAGEATPNFRALLKYEVDTAREMFDIGLPLIQKVDRELALDLDLFSRGGLEILRAIENRDYDVLRARPALSSMTKLSLVMRAVTGKFVPWMTLGSGRK